MDTQGFDENKDAAHRGGRIAGEAREKLEIESGRKIVAEGSYLKEKQSQKLDKKERH